MKVERIKISNILGIESLEFEAGAFNVVSGPNGVGKTSVLKAIKTITHGGYDATLVRKGEKSGEVVLVMDDGTEIKKRISDKTQATTIRKNGVAVARPAEMIQSFIDTLSANPIEFLRTPKKGRVDALLDSLPMKADLDRIENIIGKPFTKARDGVYGDHALTVVQAAYDQTYDERTEVNVTARAKRSSVDELLETLPKDLPEVDSESLNGLLDTITAADQERDAEFERVRTKLDGLRTASEATVTAIAEKANNDIAELRKQIEALERKIVETAAQKQADIATERAAFKAIEGKAEGQKALTTQRHSDATAEARTQIAVIRGNESAVSAANETRRIITRFEGEAAALQEEVDSKTAMLDALTAYKSELLSALPIEGLTVRDGEIYRHDIPFDQLNTAQQVEIAVEIAKLRAGALGIICVDGLEFLDAAHYESFREQALKSGLQFVVTRVTPEGQFGIDSES